MKLVIKTNKDKYFRQLVEFLKPLPPFNALMPKDLDVYAEILHKYNEFGYGKLDYAHIYVFSQEIRSMIAKKLKMSQYQFNNSISRLRKAGIVENAGLGNNFIFKFDNKVEIYFKEDGEGKSQRSKKV